MIWFDCEQDLMLAKVGNLCIVSYCVWLIMWGEASIYGLNNFYQMDMNWMKIFLEEKKREKRDNLMDK